VHTDLGQGRVDPVPEETTRVARAAFPKDDTLMRTRDELVAIFEDGDLDHE
jgi:transposase